MRSAARRGRARPRPPASRARRPGPAAPPARSPPSRHPGAACAGAIMAIGADSMDALRARSQSPAVWRVQWATGKWHIGAGEFAESGWTTAQKAGAAQQEGVALKLPRPRASAVEHSGGLPRAARVPAVAPPGRAGGARGARRPAKPWSSHSAHSACGRPSSAASRRAAAPRAASVRARHSAGGAAAAPAARRASLCAGRGGGASLGVPRPMHG